ncbi:MAG TPA: recombination mediator RecR [Leptospiraceae bacterium]|nr:recombination mediator RecR [Leptospiraceae bacterium]HMW05758.1 recombination mediator RecR [Leptospiraceae bacterium]HMX33860.1 recombination mediator RecR [Leptospiraceae bacterium]HMY33369.1 recombination mediator RecR [Leptospiraceae bacterium]HMZ65441.1 recombination mediator RecR [Leptospiraceae bacterium]
MTDSLFKKLVGALSSLPGIGKKSAYRLGFYILRMDSSSFQNFIDTIETVKSSLKFCKKCGGITEFEVCEICSSDKRQTNIICIIENPEDIFFIENTGEYKGKYHVLNGVISPLDGIGPENLRIKELLERLKEEPFEEVLIATNPTLEGDATASYLFNLIKPIGLKITRIAHGVTVGSTLEYADQYTLGKAIRARLTI